MGDVLFIRQRGIAETSIQHPVVAEVPRPRRRSNRGLITTRLQRSRFPSGGTSRSMVRCRARRGWLAQPRGLRRRGSLVERSSSLNDPRIGDLLPPRKPWTHPKRGEDRQRVRVRGILIEDQTRAWAGANRTSEAPAVCASRLQASDQRPKTSLLTSRDRPRTSTCSMATTAASRSPRVRASAASSSARRATSSRSARAQRWTRCSSSSSVASPSNSRCRTANKRPASEGTRAPIAESRAAVSDSSRRARASAASRRRASSSRPSAR